MQRRVDWDGIDPDTVGAEVGRLIASLEQDLTHPAAA
jgi:hypothetical protein